MEEFDITKLENIKYNVIQTNKDKSYINLECGLDIETTSTTLSDGSKTAFMYIWTLGFKNENYVFHGRTWDDLINVFEQISDYFSLSDDRILTCYVHNLSYEFQFMRKYFEWVNVFSISERKPIKALCNLGIEFKDSYILSGFSLENLAKNLQDHTVKKLKGDLDYSLIRHSETIMTDEEIKYCINDVVIILYYITEQIELYGDITKIPLTNTGRVRKYVKDQCYYTNSNHSKSSKGKYMRYRKIMEDLQIEKEEYIMLKRAFMGGFTHANANEMGKIHANITSIDFASSYPAVMISEKFPMSKAIDTVLTKDKDFDYYKDRFCLLFDVRFTKITASIHYENYISESKCRDNIKVLNNNGRVFSADSITMTITDIDFDIINNSYEWQNMEISNMKRYHKGYLPRPIIESVIKLYQDKTTLKDVEGKEVEYLLSKGMLNSTYGMTVTDIIRDDIIYIDDWIIEKADYNEQIEKYNKSRSRFLSYSWGVWITAYARRNLWGGINAMGDDYIYSDTDAIKFKNYNKHTKYISKYNELITRKIQVLCDYYKIDSNLLSPKTNNGIIKPLGVWEIDGRYKRFKTLGAKRYIVEFENDDLQITVAGLSKKNGLEYMKRISKNNTEVFNMFNDDLYIPKEETGKMTHTYIDDEKNFMILDYNGKESRVISRSAIHLSSCEFTLSLSRKYLEFINNLKQGYLYRGMTNI